VVKAASVCFRRCPGFISRFIFRLDMYIFNLNIYIFRLNIYIFRLKINFEICSILLVK